MFGRKKKARRKGEEPDQYADDQYTDGDEYVDDGYYLGEDGQYYDAEGRLYEGEAQAYGDEYDHDGAYVDDGEYAEDSGYAEGEAGDTAIADVGAHDTDAADESAEQEYAGPDLADAGPYSLEDLEAEEDPAVGEQWNRLDLGSVYVPMPQGSQLQVEMSPDGAPQAVHVVTEHGRVTVAAYAAPKSPGQWREVAADLAESLRSDESKVSVENGPWGREVFAVTQQADLRFIGVDGYRWMVRCVVAGPRGNVGAGSPLVATAREILADTVVNRGDEPQPARTPLPVVLPEALAQQLAQAHQQQLAARAQQAAAQPTAAVQGIGETGVGQAGNGQVPPALGGPTPPNQQVPPPLRARAPGAPVPPTEPEPGVQQPPGGFDKAAADKAAAERAAVDKAAANKTAAEKNRRRGAGGSAMQQLGG